MLTYDAVHVGPTEPSLLLRLPYNKTSSRFVNVVLACAHVYCTRARALSILFLKILVHLLDGCGLGFKPDFAMFQSAALLYGRPIVKQTLQYCDYCPSACLQSAVSRIRSI